MTENSPTSQVIKIEFKNFVPDKLVEDYFDAMYWDENFYVCLVDMPEDSPRMYLEKTKNSESIIRVFHKLEQAKIYGNMVSQKEEIPPEFVKRWEIKFYELIEYLNKTSKKFKEQGKSELKIVSSGIHDEKFVELDILWTDIEKYIN